MYTSTRTRTGIFDRTARWNDARSMCALVAGLFALVFSCWSRSSAGMDWEGARKKGQVAMILSVLGIVTTIVLGLGFILVFYSKDTSS